MWGKKCPECGAKESSWCVQNGKRSPCKEYEYAHVLCLQAENFGLMLVIKKRSPRSQKYLESHLNFDDKNFS